MKNKEEILEGLLDWLEKYKTTVALCVLVIPIVVGFFVSSLFDDRVLRVFFLLLILFGPLTIFLLWACPRKSEEEIEIEEILWEQFLREQHMSADEAKKANKDKEEIKVILKKIEEQHKSANEADEEKLKELLQQHLKDGGRRKGTPAKKEKFSLIREIAILLLLASILFLLITIPLIFSK